MAMQVFNSLYDAKKDGFTVYDRAPVAFIVSRQRAGKVELAIVALTFQPLVEKPELA